MAKRKVLNGKPLAGSPHVCRAILIGLAMSLAVVPLAAKEFNVISGDPDRTITAAEVSEIIASGEDVIKTGGGRLVIDKSLKGWKGELRVEEGYLRATHNQSFGDTNKGTVVISGATLEFESSENLLFGKEQFTVSGIGVDGCGALRHTSTTKDQWRAVFENIRLAGNTRFGGTPYGSGLSYRRWDIRGGQGTLDMGGYDLEIVCQFGIAGATIVNPGNITVTGSKSTFCLEGANARLGGNSSNKLTIGPDALLSSQAFGPAIEWTVELDGCTCNEQTASEDMTRGRFNGPVNITANGAKFSGGSDRHWAFAGPVSVAGEVATGGNINLFVIQDADDASSSRLDVLQTLRSNAKSTQIDSNLKIALYTTAGSAAAPLVSGGDLGGDHRKIFLAGTSALSLTGNQDGTRYMQANGYVKITGADKTHMFRDLAVAGDATLDISGAGVVDIRTNTLNIGTTYPGLARMRIADTILSTNWQERVKGGSSPLLIGPTRKISGSSYEFSTYRTSRGVMEICAGAAVTNFIHVGRIPVTPSSTADKDAAANCHGSLFMRGGELLLPAAPSGEYIYHYVGSQASGFFETSGGLTVIRGLFYPGASQRGCGLWYHKGGYTRAEQGTGVIFGQYSRSDYPSRGVYYHTGGTNENWGPFVSGKTLYDASNAANRDHFTVAGGFMNIDNGVDLAGAPHARTILNLNGGVFRALFTQVLTNENQTSIGSGSNKPLDDTKAWVNFNGGTYRYRRNPDKGSRKAYKAESFFYGDPDRLRITSFGQGAIFDTAGHDANLDHAVTAPYGNGLLSLALPEGVTFDDWAFAGAPYVEISGDGEGAAAVAEFDSVNGRVTGLTVTSPGCGYSTMEAKLIRGGYTNEVPLVCTLGTPTPGGLAKTGNGVLRLNVANTYGGRTRVEMGTLMACHEDAIPAGSDVEIAGGTLDAGGFEKSYGAISATSGSIENASGTFTSLVKTGPGVFMLGGSLATSAPIEVREGTLRLPVKVPGLVCGEKIYATGAATTEYDNAIPLSGLGTDLTPSLAYVTTSGGYYQPRHLVTYSGHIWNRSGADRELTFAFAFDDVLKIFIDGTRVSAQKYGSASWGALYLATTTLSPGSHSILIQLYNSVGEGGAVSYRNVSGCVGWTADIVGLAYNPNGGSSTNGADYVHIADPGDGSLLTAYPYDGTTMPSFPMLKMHPGTTLDLLGGEYVLTNEMSVTSEVFSDPVKIEGRLVFGRGAALTVEDIDLLGREQAPYPVLEASGGFGGTLPEAGDRWRFKLANDGKRLLLVPMRGSMISFR